jgi:hypothetical protein
LDVSVQAEAMDEEQPITSVAKTISAFQAINPHGKLEQEYQGPPFVNPIRTQTKYHIIIDANPFVLRNLHASNPSIKLLSGHAREKNFS